MMLMMMGQVQVAGPKKKRNGIAKMLAIQKRKR
jgi:hypothetical protein